MAVAVAASNPGMDRYLAPLFQILGTDYEELIVERGAALLKALRPEVAELDVAARIREIRDERAQLARLRAIPHIPQRTPEWYALRRERLTASNLAVIFGKGKYKSRDKLIREKVAELRGEPAEFTGNVATQWGVMFEPMASRIYAARNGNVVLYEFGLMPSPTLDCFGASPDNVSELGVMVEYKCPYRRRITGEIPIEYQYQMQGQMAVCGLKYCDYFECGMTVYNDVASYTAAAAEAPPAEHGVILEFRGEGGTEYLYSDVSDSAEANIRWSQEILKENPGRRLEAIQYWSCTTSNQVRVAFDPVAWVESEKEIRRFWADVSAAGAAPAPAPPAAAPAALSLAFDIELDTDDYLPPPTKKYAFRKTA